MCLDFFPPSNTVVISIQLHAQPYVLSSQADLKRNRTYSDFGIGHKSKAVYIQGMGLSKLESD